MKLHMDDLQHVKRLHIDLSPTVFSITTTQQANKQTKKLQMTLIRFNLNMLIFPS